MDFSCDMDSKKTKRKKVDPSFKSKRYRDKLRAEMKSLENLLPVDKPALNKKLDSQTIYRLAISYLRVKAYFRARKLNLGKTYNDLNPRIEFDVCPSDDAFCKYGEYGKEHYQGPAADTRHAMPTDDNPGSCSTGGSQHASESATGGNKMSSPCSEEEFQNWKQTTGSSVFDVGLTRFGNNYDSPLDETILYQIIDGIVIMVSADGTMMFVTENVSKYTGFTQTDLMHRCMYSIVHPQDHSTVKNVLEQYHVAQNVTLPKTEGIQENFFCRMRCYHGNTAGYIKLHCCSKAHHLPDMPKTAHTSNIVVLLYCQPFMMTGSDVINDANKEVFWSKHDLDLRFKEIEEKAVLGYSTVDVCEKSLYQFVHPEDLPVLLNVHKTVTRVTEVQTFFFRLEMKHGGWLWVYCKGKVICKNSKKFSIVFSHSPVRNEENVFIKQEALLRRQKLVSFLQNPVISNHHYDPDFVRLSGQQLKRQTNMDVPSGTFNSMYGDYLLPNGYEADERVSLSTLDIFHRSCPSSWHVNTDRHSPVLPNCHAVQKVLQRERQFLIADQRRKESNSSSIAPFSYTNSLTSDQGLKNNVHTGYETGYFSPWDNLSYSGGSSASFNCNNHHHHRYNNNNTTYMNNFGYEHPCAPLQQCNYPSYQDNNLYSSSLPMTSQRQHYSPWNVNHGNFQNNQTTQCTKGIGDKYPHGQVANNGFEENIYPISPNVHNFYSSANVRLSMICNTNGIRCPVVCNKAECDQTCHMTSYDEKPKYEVKSESNFNHCRVLSDTAMLTTKQSVTYDIEAAVYMRIVESQDTNGSNSSLDKPLYSTLTNLCENQHVSVHKASQ